MNASSVATSNTNQLSTNANSLVYRKYYGRFVELPRSDPFVKKTISKYFEVTNSIASISKSSKNSHWERLEKDVSDLGNFLVDERTPLYRHQVELVSDGLLQYLGSLKGRIHVDNNRFQQISVIIRAIMRTSADHPAILLQEIDQVVLEVRRGSAFNLWKSELLTALDTATANQWQPIIADTRVALQDIGGKLLVLGLVGAIGWPVAFLYPMFKMSSSLMRIVNEYERTKKLTPQSLFDLAKTVVMLVASIQLLSILSAYTAMGYSCLLMSAVALSVSSNNQSIKFAAPILAPHMEQMDRLVSSASSIDLSKVINRGNQFLAQHNPMHPVHEANSSTSISYTSDRVEELPSVENRSNRSSGTYTRAPVQARRVNPAEVIDLTEAEVVDTFPDSASTSASNSTRSTESSSTGLRRRFFM